ncbi:MULTISPECIES: Hsp20/alpha crystallin family protein [unclassified Wolbachia]|uniref:Hsp20/alpha crystallin family protein n=1 Tax=unclassified Wolbachia TaxID=2640676 RepID=UPI00004CA94F|nr:MULTISPECIES: Hsp20/alpha crystallin family protein [unclassified Wolbachia]MDX5562158.1 Hsp20/alpha crystallin family protein [Wolbachia endosymbiont of Andrena bicolor]POG51944.1 heat-shock protein Hsp20 [Wolbachia sp. wRi_2]ACN95438.1 Small heat shock protein [Wolbachia sp. wRi]EAL58808.1 heat shock protein, class I [Wolbachia endosymbiont of Drosophila ananassae]POG53279.1 heat-shock protein Hsp20 [Wolbachia sp. wRi]
MSNIVHSNKNNKCDNFSVRGLQRAVDNIFDSFFTGWDSELSRRGSSLLPACDFYETKESYCLSLELPGISKESIDISISSDSLIVKGEKTCNNESKDKQFYHRERYYGSFYRSIQLPVNVEQDKVSANFSDGILHVTIPKSEKHIKRIDVK